MYDEKTQIKTKNWNKCTEKFFMDFVNIEQENGNVNIDDCYHQLIEEENGDEEVVNDDEHFELRNQHEPSFHQWLNQ